MTTKLNEDKIKGTNNIKKRKGIKYLIIFSIISLFAVTVIVNWKIQSDIHDVYAPSKTKVKTETVSARMNDLVGQWSRTDGGYVIEIRAADASGIGGVQRLGLCHCTDLPSASLLAQEFGDSFFFNRVGTTIELP